MTQVYHSIQLDTDLCMGCTNCVKRCPTQAIRVRDGKARIIKERCIDCGECIRICPHHAKKAVVDPLTIIEDYQYTIALPAPSLYAQFNHLEEVDTVLAALRLMGFDEVYEVARAAELVSDCTRRLMGEGKLKTPVISSACPVVVRLIRIRFPNLLDNLLPVLPPVEVAARLAKQEFCKVVGCDPSQVGCIFISPCPAKSTATKRPLGYDHSDVDGVVAIRDIYPRLLSYMRQVQDVGPLATAGRMGVGWGSSGGESAAILRENYLAADGIENITRVLESMEDDQMSDLEFVELNACAGGCVGGVLTVENPFLAKTKLKKLTRHNPNTRNHLTQEQLVEEFLFDHPIRYWEVMQLAGDMETAIRRMEQIRLLEQSLPGMDCGACGAPTCRALAEDAVLGFGSIDMCIYHIKEKLAGANRPLTNQQEESDHESVRSL